MAKKKALILYGSLTGNTEKIGKALGEVCTEYGFETKYVKIEPRRDWDADPVDINEYDLVALGSPIIAGLPYKEVSMVMGLQGTKTLLGPKLMKQRIEQMAASGKGGPHSQREGTGIPGVVAPAIGTGAPGSKGETGKTIYGVAYTTYGGSGVGPEECYGCLESLTEFLRVNGARTVGKFACPGRELRHGSVDRLAEKFHINIDDAQSLMSRYKENPASEEFTKYSEDQMKLLDKLADDESFGEGVHMLNNNDPLGCGKPGCLMWHYDFDNRPSERDVTKAKIFMAEIIEDYFLSWDGDPRAPYSMYTCIS